MFREIYKFPIKLANCKTRFFLYTFIISTFDIFKFNSHTQDRTALTATILAPILSPYRFLKTIIAKQPHTRKKNKTSCTNRPLHIFQHEKNRPRIALSNTIFPPHSPHIRSVFFPHFSRLTTSKDTQATFAIGISMKCAVNVVLLTIS